MSESQSGLSFRAELLRNVVYNLRRIVFFCLVIAVASAVYSLTREPRFTASALVMVPGGSEGGFGSITSSMLGGSVGDLGINLPAIGSPASPDLDLAFQVMTSRVVLERILVEFNLMERFKVISTEEGIRRLTRRVNVFLHQEGFFSVSADGDTAEEAAAIVNALIDFSNDRLATVVTSRARRARIETGETLQLAFDSLTTALDHLKEFREETGMILPEEQTAQTIRLLGEVEASLITAESELAALSRTMSPYSSSIQSLSEQINYLRNALRTRLGEGDSLSISPGLENTPELLSEYEKLQMEVETRRALYILIRQEYEQLKLEEVRDSPTLEVIIPSVPPFLRSYPKRAKMVIKNTIIGFIISIMWIAVLVFIRHMGKDPNINKYWKTLGNEFLSQLFLRKKAGKRHSRLSD